MRPVLDRKFIAHRVMLLCLPDELAVGVEVIRALDNLVGLPWQCSNLLDQQVLGIPGLRAIALLLRIAEGSICRAIDHDVTIAERRARDDEIQSAWDACREVRIEEFWKVYPRMEQDESSKESPQDHLRPSRHLHAARHSFVVILNP